MASQAPRPEPRRRTAASLVIPSKSVEDYEDFAAAMIQSLRPQGAVFQYSDGLDSLAKIEASPECSFECALASLSERCNVVLRKRTQFSLESLRDLASFLSCTAFRTGLLPHWPVGKREKFTTGGDEEDTENSASSSRAERTSMRVLRSLTQDCSKLATSF